MLNASTKDGNDRQVLQMADKLFDAEPAEAVINEALDSKRLTPFGLDLFKEIKIRCAEHQKNDLPQVKLTTTKGDIVIELFEDQAPNTVANFISLVKAGKYDDVPFHRVIDGFMAQTGDVEKKDGMGGPGYTIKSECVRDDFRKHFSGSVSMANKGPDTGGSQFFLTFVATSHLDGHHTVFGRVLEGMDVLDKITRTYAQGFGDQDTKIPGVTPDKIVSAQVLRARDHEYKPVTVPDKPEN